MKILFICEANVGRSQMAEAYYNLFSETNDASSAGVVDLIKKYKGRPAKEIVAIMKEDGIDISKQKIKKVTKKMVNNAKKIIVLCKKEICPEFVLQNSNVTFCMVKDPYKKNQHTIKSIRDDVKYLVKKLLNGEK